MTYTTGELNGRTLADFEQLASKQGECWCMFYQRATTVGRGLSSAERKRKNRRDKKALVRRGRSHAILVYDGQTPVGWCQYGRQDELPRIDARRTYRKAAPAVRVAKFMENHVLLRRPRPPREGRRQDRAARGPRIDQEARRRN